MSEQPMTEPVAAPAVATEAVAAPSERRKIQLAFLPRLLRFLFAVALLAGGLAFGYRAYETNRPAPAVVGDPSIATAGTPESVAELANAIAANNADSIRSALAQDMFSRYTAEMERWGIARVSSVETLGTFADGNRTATALVLHGATTDANAFTLNLVVVTQDGRIVRLR